MSYDGLCSHSASALKRTVSLQMSAGHLGNGIHWWWVDQAGHPAVAIRLGMDAVQVLGNSDTSAVQQELRQEVALCCGGRTIKRINQILNEI